MAGRKNGREKEWPKVRPGALSVKRTHSEHTFRATSSPRIRPGPHRGLRQRALTRGQPPCEAPFAASNAAWRLFISKPTNS
jgi:hypothetical protein